MAIPVIITVAFMTSNAYSQHARGTESRLLVLLGLVCLALVGGALYFQFALGEDPCPWCIMQRYAFIFVAIFAFVAAALPARGAPRYVAVWLALISAIGGIIAAGKHVYILSSVQSCGFDTLQPIVDGLPPAKWLPAVFKTAGLCDTPYPPVLGLSLPAWALLGFVIAFCSLLGVVIAHRRARVRFA